VRLFPLIYVVVVVVYLLTLVPFRLHCFVVALLRCCRSYVCYSFVYLYVVMPGCYVAVVLLRLLYVARLLYVVTRFRLYVRSTFIDYHVYVVGGFCSFVVRFARLRLHLRCYTLPTWAVVDTLFERCCYCTFVVVVVFHITLHFPLLLIDCCCYSHSNSVGV